MLDPTIRERIKSAYEKLNATGDLFTRAQFAGYFETFRAKFGPDILRKLDGVELLATMHGSFGDKKNSLAYWLERKPDDEFPTKKFGGIRGRSAFKFGVYVDATSGQWITGTPQNKKAISESDAVKIARKQRDQFVGGCELLDALPNDGTDADYAELQKRLPEVAPDVCETAWAHKYFSILYSDKLDDFHVPGHQRFNLIKLLEVPPEGNGRYIAAGRYVAIAKELDLAISQLTTILCYLGCEPHSYWRIGTRSRETNESYWELMREGNYVSIGWRSLGNLLTYTKDDHAKEDAKRIMTSVYYPDNLALASKKLNEILRFVSEISEQEGDFVIASDGERILGIGKVTGSYIYKEELDFPHCRPVEWLNLDEWKVSSPEGLLTTVHKMKNASNLVEIERHLIGPHYWVEKTLVKGHPDRESGEYALGSALWSPQARTDGNDIYANMRELMPGDVVLHFIDNKEFSGVSVAATRADPSFIGLERTNWVDRDGYLIRLKEYEPLKPPLSREWILDDPNVFARLTRILEAHRGRGLFYNREHNLNQGAYLTEAPIELVDVLNTVYCEKTEGKSLPHVFKPLLPPEPEKYTVEDFVAETGFPKETIESWKRKIERKKHIILQGPPGTGKTWIAERLAKYLKSEYGGFSETVQFHPAYSYEDFIQGIRPTVKGGTPFFDVKMGRFLEFCKEAEKHDQNARCVLVIDEINRANLPRVFGELMYLLEYRERKIALAYEGELQIPENAFIIGTMNTADRSIRLFDHALRRRFSFVCLRPNYEVLRNYLKERNLPADSLVALLNDINMRISDARYEVGISFFLQGKDEQPETLRQKWPQMLQDIWEGEIEPYLEEYFYDNQDEVTRFRWVNVKERALNEDSAAE